jgi:TrmH family RNA methyltransferase
LNMERLTSIKNPRLVHIKELLSDKDYRAEHKEFVLEGDKFIQELSGKDISYIIVSDKPGAKTRSGQDDFTVPDTLLKKLSDTETPQGAIAVVKRPGYALAQVKNGRWIIAEGIQDPGNLGTIIRTIEAAGAQGLIYTEGTVDPFSPKVVRSSAGSVLRVPVIQVKDVMALKKAVPGMKLMATVVSDGMHYKEADTSGFCGIILGSEGQGLAEETLKLAEERVSIPLQGRTESLNVAITAGILLFK